MFPSKAPRNRLSRQSFMEIYGNPNNETIIEKPTPKFTALANNASKVIRSVSLRRKQFPKLQRAHTADAIPASNSVHGCNILELNKLHLIEKLRLQMCDIQKEQAILEDQKTTHQRKLASSNSSLQSIDNGYASVTEDDDGMLKSHSVLEEVDDKIMAEIDDFQLFIEKSRTM